MMMSLITKKKLFYEFLLLVFFVMMSKQDPRLYDEPQYKKDSYDKLHHKKDPLVGDDDEPLNHKDALLWVSVVVLLCDEEAKKTHFCGFFLLVFFVMTRPKNPTFVGLLCGSSSFAGFFCGSFL